MTFEPRDPTPKELASPLFEAIWQTIKTWDINAPWYSGYCGATGNHAAVILRALTAALSGSPQVEAGTVEAMQDAIFTALEDMGKDGKAVCGYSKARLRLAYGNDPLGALEYTLDEAKAIVIECEEMHGKRSPLRNRPREQEGGEAKANLTQDEQRIVMKALDASSPLLYEFGAHPPLPADGWKEGAEAMREAAAKAALDEHASWYLTESEMTEYGKDNRRIVERIATVIRSLPTPREEWQESVRKDAIWRAIRDLPYRTPDRVTLAEIETAARLLGAAIAPDEEAP